MTHPNNLPKCQKLRLPSKVTERTSGIKQTPFTLFLHYVVLSNYLPINYSVLRTGSTIYQKPISSCNSTPLSNNDVFKGMLTFIHIVIHGKIHLHLYFGILLIFKIYKKHNSEKRGGFCI